jgi:hypothetical protein
VSLTKHQTITFMNGNDYMPLLASNFINSWWQVEIVYKS